MRSTLEDVRSMEGLADTLCHALGKEPGNGKAPCGQRRCFRGDRGVRELKLRLAEDGTTRLADDLEMSKRELD